MRAALPVCATYGLAVVGGYRYGCAPDEIAKVRAWAQAWSTRIGVDLAEAEPWLDDE